MAGSLKSADYFKLIKTLTPVSEPLLKSNGNFMYLYEAQSETRINDWKTDLWHWREGGGKVLQFEGMMARKKPYKTLLANGETSNTFTRTAYWIQSYPLRFLVVYEGDSSKQEKFPHGNSKSEIKLRKNFVATMPSQRLEMKRRPGFPSNTYKSLVVEAPCEILAHTVTAPRDKKQVENFQGNERQKVRLSRDTAYNLHYNALTYQFIKHITSYPDYIIIMHLDALSDKITAMIKNCRHMKIALGYDTTFKLGDTYVSALVIRFVEFEGSPVVPFLFLMHHRKDGSSLGPHHTLFRYLVERFPQLLKCDHLYFVTDKELAFVSAIKLYLPNIKMFRCWNHVFTDGKMKLRSLGIGSLEEIQRYMSDHQRLFRQKSEMDYLRELNTILSRGENDKNRWHEGYAAYYNKNIASEIDMIGSWNLLPFGIDAAYSNESESYNAVMKRFQEWRECPEDVIERGLSALSQYHDVEIQRGRYGLGTYNLREEFSRLYDSDEPPIIEKSMDPGKIVDELQNGYFRLRQQEADDLQAKIDAAEENGTVVTEETPEPQRATVMSSAAQLVKDNRIVRVGRGEYCVTKTDYERGQLVNLVPSGYSFQSCTCGATHTCSHISGTAMFLGYYGHEKSRKPGNWMRTMKNCRTKADKTSGRKKPRPKDTNPQGVPVKSSPPNKRTKCVIDADDGFLSTAHPEGSSLSIPDHPEGDTVNTDHPEGDLHFDDVSTDHLEGDIPNTDRPKGKILSPVHLDGDILSTDHLEGDIPSDDGNVEQDETHVEISFELEDESVGEPESVTNSFAAMDLKELDGFFQYPLDDLPYIHPSQQEIDQIVERNFWLTDIHVAAASKLIRAMIQANGWVVGGLFTPQFGTYVNFPKITEESWIQILHNGENHWITAYKSADENVVRLYDSQYTGDCNHAIACASALLRSEESTFSFQYRKCQNQHTGSDCGIFAIAFAVTLASGGDPESHSYGSDSDMRKHLQQCIATNKMSPFPTTEKRVKKSKTSAVKMRDVYCHCRLTDYVPPVEVKKIEKKKISKSDSDWNYIQCSNKDCFAKWFHIRCEDVQEEDKLANMIWFCRRCQRNQIAN